MVGEEMALSWPGPRMPSAFSVAPDEWVWRRLQAVRLRWSVTNP